MLKSISLFLLVFILLSSCARPEQEPEFRRIDNLKVGKISGSSAVLTGDAVFYNPNEVKAKLKKIAIDVELEGKSIGTINQSFNTKIPALAEFTVPLEASFDISDVGLLNGLLSIFGGKKVEVRYKGTIQVSMYGFPTTVPVDYTEELRL